MNGLDTILTDLAGAAQSYLANGITVEVKTNYTPGITVYTGSSSPNQATQPGQGAGFGSALSQLIGLEAGVVVKDAASGRVLASYGPNNGDPPTDWLRVSIALALIGLLGFGVFKMVRAI